MTTPINQGQMARAAREQALDRSRRTGATMYVYERLGVWFVRSEEEGKPDGARLMWACHAQGGGAACVSTT